MKLSVRLWRMIADATSNGSPTIGSARTSLYRKVVSATCDGNSDKTLAIPLLLDEEVVLMRLLNDHVSRETELGRRVKQELGDRFE